MKRRVAVAWSSGKDSAWALCELLKRRDLEVSALLSTVRESDRSIGIHETSKGLLQAQVDAIGLPLFEVSLPWPCPNAEYEKRMRDAAYLLLASDITALAFGDLHLADVRQYREQLFADTALDLLFPLWERGTAQLAGEMLDGGLRAKICSIRRGMAQEWLGMDFNRQFLNALPGAVDPCGENGEFHTIVTACPAMSGQLELQPRERGADEHHEWMLFSQAY